MRPQAERRALSPHRIEQAPARVLERACPPCRRPRGYRPRGGRRPVSEPSTHSRAIRTGPHVRKPAERVGVRDVAYRRETRAHYPRSRDSVATVPTLNSRSGRRPDGRHPVVRVPPRTPGESASPPRARMHEPVARTRLVSCGPQSPSLAQDRRCALQAGLRGRATMDPPSARTARQRAFVRRVGSGSHGAQTPGHWPNRRHDGLPSDAREYATLRGAHTAREAPAISAA